MRKGSSTIPVFVQGYEPSRQVVRVEGGGCRVIVVGERYVTFTEMRLLDEPHTVRRVTGLDKHPLKELPTHIRRYNRGIKDVERKINHVVMDGKTTDHIVYCTNHNVDKTMNQRHTK